MYGGGGIHPDVIVTDDTLTTEERDFIRAAAPQRQVDQHRAAGLRARAQGHRARDFKVPAAWTHGADDAHDAAGVKIDPKFEAAARTFLTRDLENRVTRLAFGDAAAKARNLAEDHQLLKAIELLEHSTTQAQLLAAAGRACRASNPDRASASRLRRIRSAVPFLGSPIPLGWTRDRSPRTPRAPPPRSADRAVLHARRARRRGRESWWFVLHGYGQLAGDFIRYFSDLATTIRSSSRPRR